MALPLALPHTRTNACAPPILLALVQSVCRHPAHGCGLRHNPEFTTCEFYQAFGDFDELVDTTEQMLVELVTKVSGSAQVVLPAPRPASQVGAVMEFFLSFLFAFLFLFFHLLVQSSHHIFIILFEENLIGFCC
jgi:hypothetical protein